MNYLTAEERYTNDDTFRAMVDLLSHYVMSLELTPSEIREAAVYACIRVERTRVRTFDFRASDIDQSLLAALSKEQPK